MSYLDHFLKESSVATSTTQTSTVQQAGTTHPQGHGHHNSSAQNLHSPSLHSVQNYGIPAFPVTSQHQANSGQLQSPNVSSTLHLGMRCFSYVMLPCALSGQLDKILLIFPIFLFLGQSIESEDGDIEDNRALSLSSSKSNLSEISLVNNLYYYQLQ